MDKKQEEKFRERVATRAEDDIARYNAMRFAWISCLEANGIEEPREPTRSIGDLAKTFESLAFAITDASNKITAAVNAGIERANEEVVNAEAKWEPNNCDPVIFNYQNVVSVGVYHHGQIFCCDDFFMKDQVSFKPFDASKIGQRWDEI